MSAQHTPSPSSSTTRRSQRWSIHALQDLDGLAFHSTTPSPARHNGDPSDIPTPPPPSQRSVNNRSHRRTSSSSLPRSLRRITSTSALLQPPSSYSPSVAAPPSSSLRNLPRTPAFERAYAFFENRGWDSDRDLAFTAAAAAAEPTSKRIVSRSSTLSLSSRARDQQEEAPQHQPSPSQDRGHSGDRAGADRDFLTWHSMGEQPLHSPTVRPAPVHQSYDREHRTAGDRHSGEYNNSPSPNKESRSFQHARGWVRTPRATAAAATTSTSPTALTHSRTPHKERMFRDERAFPARSPAAFMDRLFIQEESGEKPSSTSHAQQRHVRRPSSQTLLNVSMLDASFQAASIGDRTYDALEVAVESNRERRRSMGLTLRPANTASARPSSPSSTGSSTLSVSTPPSSTSDSLLSPVVPMSKRRPSCTNLTAKLEAAQQEEEVLQDENRFLAAAPSHRTPARRSPLRHQATTNFVGEAPRRQQSAIFEPNASVGVLLDSESFQLTPPSSARTPAPSRTQAASTPSAATAFTPHRRHPVSSHRTTHAADVTVDIATLLGRGASRPKRASGTEESFLVGAGAQGLQLADLSDAEGDDTIVEEPIVPASLRPSRQVSSTGGMSRSATLAHIDTRGLPVAGSGSLTSGGGLPRSDSTRTITRSDSTRTIQRSDSTRTIQRSDSTRAIQRSDSTRGSGLTRVGSSRVPGSMSSRALPSSASTRFVSSHLAREAHASTTPRRVAVDRPDVPLSMRRTPATQSRPGSSVPAPSSEDRWADAVERFPAPILTPATHTPAAERRMPTSVSSRRISVAATGSTLPRSGSTRALERTSTLPRSGSTRNAVATEQQSRSTLPRSGSGRDLTRGDSAASSYSETPGSGMTRTSSMKRLDTRRTSLAPTPRQPVAETQRQSMSLAPTTATASRQTLPAPTPRRSLAPTASLGHRTVTKVSSRPSLAPRTRALAEATPTATNIASRRTPSTPGAGVALARTKLSSPPPPDHAAARRAGPTAAVGSAAARLEEAKARLAGGTGLGGGAGGAAAAGAAPRESAIAQARIAAHRTSSTVSGLAGIRQRMGAIEAARAARYQ
ncbi:uncharacterized protein EHS24_008844 [Apiotrichum porosum]|uniref:Uncharacterized protein n=1 Tax=Apiotrichum porosum TaxID=105984 RepID=A0A427XMY5_9TREE|nr:uncharacterized protein EHS24_008844 [Apiotrichum porosum]RSH80271.1 hypothetical protein EHS24_008844 [Apiotrichum porosum]